MIRRIVPTTMEVNAAFMGVPSEMAREAISETFISSDQSSSSQYSQYFSCSAADAYDCPFVGQVTSPEVVWSDVWSDGEQSSCSQYSQYF